jgi:hypothetical protein
LTRPAGGAVEGVARGGDQDVDRRLDLVAGRGEPVVEVVRASH